MLGYLVRSHRRHIFVFIRQSHFVSMALVILAMIGAGFYFLHFGNENNLARSIAWFVMNCSLIFIALNWADAHPRNTHQRVIETIGRYSLPIYLWHVVPMFLLKGFDLHFSYPRTYYLVCVLFMVFLIFVIQLDKVRHGYAKILVFGQNKAISLQAYRRLPSFRSFISQSLRE